MERVVSCAHFCTWVLEQCGNVMWQSLRARREAFNSFGDLFRLHMSGCKSDIQLIDLIWLTFQQWITMWHRQDCFIHMNPIWFKLTFYISLKESVNIHSNLLRYGQTRWLQDRQIGWHRFLLAAHRFFYQVLFWIFLVEIERFILFVTVTNTSKRLNRDKSDFAFIYFQVCSYLIINMPLQAYTPYSYIFFQLESDVFFNFVSLHKTVFAACIVGKCWASTTIVRRTSHCIPNIYEDIFKHKRFPKPIKTLQVWRFLFLLKTVVLLGSSLSRTYQLTIPCTTQ